MVIDLRIMKSEIPVITMDNIPIERVQSHKLLGVWLIFFKGVKGIWRTSKFYCSVILSVLEYGDILWHGGLTLSQSQDIERIQKRALRIITPDLSYEDALASSKLLPLNQRRGHTLH